MRFVFFRLATCVGLILGFATAEAAGTGERCGSAAKMHCDKGLWCDPRPGRCTVGRAHGTCAAVPAVCTMIYQPVCGCDGTTYSNDCVRRSSRVGKRHDGAC